MRELKGRSEAIFIVTIIFLGLSFLAVCLRCFVRIKLVKAFGWDDALMVFAMALNILFALCGITGSLYGMGDHVEDVQAAGNIETALFWWWLGQTSYVFTCVIAKISIALALLRLTVAKLHSMILWAVIAVSVIVGIVFWFMLTLQCQPVEYFWQRLTREGSCMSIDSLIAIAWVYSIVATVCDLVLGLLPAVLVWNLQMNVRTKAALAAILGMGCVASAAVIVRIPFLHTYKDPDFLYATTDISIWSNVEAGLGITAGSLVTLRPLFRWFREGSYRSYRGTRTRRGESMPLSSGNGNVTNRSGHDRNATKFWRPDIYPDDTHGIITTVHTSNGGSRSSSQTDLNPKQNSPTGVNVQKSFLVTTDAV